MISSDHCRTAIFSLRLTDVEGSAGLPICDQCDSKELGQASVLMYIKSRCAESDACVLMYIKSTCTEADECATAGQVWRMDFRWCHSKGFKVGEMLLLVASAKL